MQFQASSHVRHLVFHPYKIVSVLFSRTWRPSISSATSTEPLLAMPPWPRANPFESSENAHRSSKPKSRDALELFSAPSPTPPTMPSEKRNRETKLFVLFYTHYKHRKAHLPVDPHLPTSTPRRPSPLLRVVRSPRRNPWRHDAATTLTPVFPGHHVVVSVPVAAPHFCKCAIPSVHHLQTFLTVQHLGAGAYPIGAPALPVAPAMAFHDRDDASPQPSRPTTPTKYRLWPTPSSQEKPD